MKNYEEIMKKIGKKGYAAVFKISSEVRPLNSSGFIGPFY